jgi:hypothetical protein
MTDNNCKLKSVNVCIDDVNQIIQCSDCQVKGKIFIQNGIEQITKLSQEDEFNLRPPHSIVNIAQSRNIEILVLPINLFSDDTSGTSSHRYNLYESISFKFASMPLQLQTLNKYSYIVSTGNAIHPITQLNSVVDDLLKIEDGVSAIHGTTGKQILVFCPIAAFLGDNHRQSDVCGLLGPSAHANCRICERTQDLPMGIIGVLRTKGRLEQQQSIF